MAAVGRWEQTSGRATSILSSARARSGRRALLRILQTAGMINISPTTIQVMQEMKCPSLCNNEDVYKDSAPTYRECMCAHHELGLSLTGITIRIQQWGHCDTRSGGLSQLGLYQRSEHVNT